MKMTSVFAPILKSTENDDGTLYVYGKATGPDLDLDQQRCDPEWLKSAMPEWFGFGPGGPGGNIRGQHNPGDAVGKAVEHDILNDGHYIKAHIVDPVAVLKVKNDVYTGFSIGIGQPRVEKSTTAPNGVIKGGKIFEVSLVDRPALPTAQFTMCKAAKPGMEIHSSDFDSKRMLVRCGEFIEKKLGDDDPGEMTVSIADGMSEEKLQLLRAKVNIDETSDPSALIEAAEETREAIERVPVEIKSATPEIQKHLDSLESEEEKQKWLDRFEFLRKAYMSEFDHQAAVDLAKATNDMPPEYDPEQVDIENAQEAISILSQLIISEASEMCDNPAEDCDIQILLSAVDALRHFICREQQQAMGADKPVPMFLSAEPELTKAKYSADQLRQMLKEGKAMRNPAGEPSYPIGDKKDLQNAIHAVGRGSGDHNAIRAYIKRRAKALGATNMLPEDWNSSNKAAEVQETEVLEKAETEEVEETPEVTKDETPQEDVLYKAFSAYMEKDDNPLLKSFEAIIEKSMAATATQLGELGERLGRVEEMATPGGPALKRTEGERVEARKQDISNEVRRFKALASNTEDHTLRKGYAAKAAVLEAELKAL